MKHRSKFYSWLPAAAASLALSASVGLAANPIIVVDTFDNGTSTGNNIWSWYGGSTYSWDGTQDHTGNNGGSLHIMQPSAAGDDTIIVPETFPALGGGAWWWGGQYDLTTYTNVSCWLKWDTNNSTMSIPTFNTEGTGGFSIWLNDNGGWGGGNRHSLANQLIPNSASNGWVHLNIPIDPTIPNLNAIVAVEYYDWKPAPWSGSVAFWVDDVQFEPSSLLVPPPPTISGPTKAIQGLNVFAGSAFNTYYDRQEALLVQKTGVSWAGLASAGHPVTYSFTITNFPSDPSTYGGEAYFFLCPNPVANDGAGDWNETNAAIAFIQQSAPSNTVMSFHTSQRRPRQQNVQRHRGLHERPRQLGWRDAQLEGKRQHRQRHQPGWRRGNLEHYLHLPDKRHTRGAKWQYQQLRDFSLLRPVIQRSQRLQYLPGYAGE